MGSATFEILPCVLTYDMCVCFFPSFPYPDYFHISEALECACRCKECCQLYSHRYIIADVCLESGKVPVLQSKMRVGWRSLPFCLLIRFGREAVSATFEVFPCMQTKMRVYILA